MKSVLLRLPPELHAKLKAEAEAESRSVNNLMLIILHEYLSKASEVKK